MIFPREDKLRFHNKRQQSIKNDRHDLERYFGRLFNQSRECYEKLDCIPENERLETDWVSKIAEYISNNPARITELVLKDMGVWRD